MLARRRLLVLSFLAVVAVSATHLLIGRGHGGDLPDARIAVRSVEPERSAASGVEQRRERAVVAPEPRAEAAEVATVSTRWEFPPIRGRVVWRDGAGDIADARVVARRSVPQHLRSWAFTAGPQEDAPPAATSRPGDDGSFTLDVQRGGVFVVLLEHPEASAAPAVDVGPGAFVTLEAHPAARLAGRVIAEESGDPIRGADVRVFDAGAEDYVRARTDADGLFEVTGLVPGDGGTFAVADGYAKSAWTELDLEAGRTVEVELELGPGRSLTGFVRDARTLAPLGGAEVSTWSFIGRNATTDSNGAFLVWGAGPGHGALSARAPGYAPREVRYGADDERIDVDLEPAHVVHGRLVDERGRPAGDATINVRSLWEDGTWAHFLGEVRGPYEDGRFLVRGTPRRFEILARHPRPGSQVLHRPDTSALPARRDGTLDVGELVLRPTVIVVGRVVSATGVAVAGARVTLAASAEVSVPPTGIELTNADGVAQFRYVEEGPYVAHVTAPGRAAVEFAFDVRLPSPHGGEQEVEWRLPAGSLFSGRVRDEEGQPVEDAFVRLRLAGGERGPSGRTDAGGLFELTGVLAPVVQVRVSPRAQFSDELLPASVVPNAETGVEIVLRRLGRPLAGRVVDAEGRGVAQAFVALIVEDSPAGGGASTGPDGTFELVGPRHGSIEIGAWRTRAFRANDTNVHVREQELGRRIVGRSAAPTARVEATAGEAGLRLTLPTD